MGDFDLQFCCNQGAGHGGIDIADDNDPIRLMLEADFFEPEHYLGGLPGMRSGADFEVNVWRGYLQVAEKGFGHCDIIVLPGVDQHVVDPGSVPGVVFFDCGNERGDFHEVRPRPDYADYFYFLFHFISGFISGFFYGHLLSLFLHHRDYLIYQGVERYPGLFGHRQGLIAFLEVELGLYVFLACEQDKPPGLFQELVHCPYRPPEDAVHGHFEGRCFAVHGAAAADYQVRKPDQVEAVDRVVGDYDLAVFYQTGPGVLDIGGLSFFVPGQDDHLHVLPFVQKFDHSFEQRLRFGVVVVGLSCRRADGHDQFIRIEFQVGYYRRVGNEVGDVNIFLDSRVLEKRMALVHFALREQFRNYEKARPDYHLGEFIIHDDNGRNIQQLRCEQLGTRPVRDG